MQKAFNSGCGRWEKEWKEVLNGNPAKQGAEVLVALSRPCRVDERVEYWTGRLWRYWFQGHTEVWILWCWRSSSLDREGDC